MDTGATFATIITEKIVVWVGLESGSLSLHGFPDWRSPDYLVMSLGFEFWRRRVAKRHCLGSQISWSGWRICTFDGETAVSSDPNGADPHNPESTLKVRTAGLLSGSLQPWNLGQPMRDLRCCAVGSPALWGRIWLYSLLQRSIKIFASNKVQRSRGSATRL